MRTTESIIEMAETLAELHRGAEFQGGDPYVAFRANRISVFEREFEESFDGMLRYHKGKFHTFLNTGRGCTPGRQRFTAGHEFAHYAIEHHREGVRTGRMLHASVTGFVSDQTYEKEADMFAAHFLMPTLELTAACRKAKDRWGAEEILAVSQAFGTSLTASARRCVTGLPGDSLLYVWNEGAVHWVIGGGAWVEHARAWRVKDHSDLVPGSPTGLELANPASCSPFRQGGSTLTNWSKRVGPTSHANSILVEYVIPRGRYGPMTLLRPAE